MYHLPNEIRCAGTDPRADVGFTPGVEISVNISSSEPGAVRKPSNFGFQMQQLGS